MHIQATSKARLDVVSRLLPVLIGADDRMSIKAAGAVIKALEVISPEVDEYIANGGAEGSDSAELLLRTYRSVSFGVKRMEGMQAAPGIIFARVLTVSDGRRCDLCAGEHLKLYRKTHVPSAPPFHVACRCDLQPIDFYQARRMGLVDYGPGRRGVVFLDPE